VLHVWTAENSATRKNASNSYSNLFLKSKLGSRALFEKKLERTAKDKTCPNDPSFKTAFRLATHPPKWVLLTVKNPLCLLGLCDTIACLHGGLCVKRINQAALSIKTPPSEVEKNQAQNKSTQPSLFIRFR